MSEAAIAQQIEALQQQIEALQNPRREQQPEPEHNSIGERLHSAQEAKRLQRVRADEEESQRRAEQRERERPQREAREAEIDALDQQLAAMKTEHKRREEALLAKRAELLWRRP